MITDAQGITLRSKHELDIGVTYALAEKKDIRDGINVTFHGWMEQTGSLEPGVWYLTLVPDGDNPPIPLFTYFAG